jgi:aarF domain-containing kinase
MDYLPGEKMVDGIRSSFRRVAEASGKDFEAMEAEQIRAIRKGTLERRDLGVAKREAEKTKTLLAWSDYIRNWGIFIANWSLAPLVMGVGKGWEYYASEAPPNLGRIFELLIRVHAHEIFSDGAFNADVHPGNVLLMPDGRLGLVDYGQVKRMSVKDRISYAKLIIALSRDDKEEVVRIMTKEIGFATRDMNPDVIYKTAAFWNDRDTDDVTDGMNVHYFLEWLDKTDPVRNVNDEFIMVGRVSILLRGTANAFGLQIRMSDYWKVDAKAFLESCGVEY